MPYGDQQPIFIPAETPDEAISRIYSLTGAIASGTRGEKRAMLALRDALRLDVDTARTNAEMGQRVADSLGTHWEPSKHTLRNTVTLAGLNALLEGATDAFHDGSLSKLRENKPVGLNDSRWASFNPAPSKIEAVNRISDLTLSGPEHLGPGSKERKRVLLNLARVLAPSLLERSLSKTKLGAALADEFGAPWSADCESTGETISLIGLNTILAGAELRLGKLGVARALLFGTPEQEGQALAAALVDGWQRPSGEPRLLWDGVSCVKWMQAQGLTRLMNQTEWPGFYWEARGKAILNRAFSPNPNPPRVLYVGEPFDYSLKYVWDLKAHTETKFLPVSNTIQRGDGIAILNDQVAMNECIDEQGLGFLVASGQSIVDQDGEFKKWHDGFKAAQGKFAAPSNSGKSRKRKKAFAPQHVEAFWFANSEAFDAAKAAGHITDYKQGKQAPVVDDGRTGASRNLKYRLHMRKARDTSLEVARFAFPGS